MKINQHPLTVSMLAATLAITLLIASLSISATSSQLIYQARFLMKFQGNEVTTLTIPVCTQFTLDLFIELPKNLPPGWGMVMFDFRLQFDPTLLELVQRDGSMMPPGWKVALRDGIGFVEGKLEGPPYSNDAAWEYFRFHCRGKGITLVRVLSIDTIYVGDGQTTPEPIFPPEVTVTINQIEPRPVGGIVVPANKLEILTPYLALAGLIATVSTVVIVRRRREA